MYSGVLINFIIHQPDIFKTNIPLEKCSVEFYNVLPVWIGHVYQLENSFIQIYKHRVFLQLEACFLVFSFPAFLLTNIDDKPEQTRYGRSVKATHSDW